MNFKKVFFVGSVLFISLSTQVLGSAVSFSSPQPWITQRANNISAKFVIDTSLTKGKSVNLKAYVVKNGRKSTLKSKTVKGGETSGDFDFSVNGEFVGGKNYVGIDWSVSGVKDQKGTLAPVGYMPLSENDLKKIAVDEVKGEFNVSGFKSDVTIGKTEIDFAWSLNGLVVAAKIEGEKLCVKFDPKNGKNSFPAFADRCLTLSKDSTLIKSQYPKRSFTDKGINYEKNEWKNEINIKNEGDFIIATIPWHDLGMIAQKGRIFGIAAIVDDKVTYPENANKAIPGTWGNIELK